MYDYLFIPVMQAARTLSPFHTQVQVELKKGQTMMIDVDLQTTADIFQEIVSTCSGMPFEKFALYFQSKQLEGEAALSSWGVEKDAIVELKMRGRGGADEIKDEPTAEQVEN